MNWFDLAIAALIVISVMHGFRNGISRSGLGMIAVVAAFAAASWLFPSYQLGFFVVFVGLICVAGAIPCFFGKQLRGAINGWLDGFLGGTFGLVNAILLAVFAVLAMMAFAPKAQRQTVAHSKLGPYALEAAYAVVDVLPDELKTRIQHNYQELELALPAKYRERIPPLPRNEI